MERFQELREGARKKIKLADHMLTQTYPLVKDPRLLLTVLENVFLAMSYSMSSLLYYDLLFKRVPPFADDFDSKVRVFRQRCMERYSIDNRHLMIMKELKTIILEHRKSPVEFVKNDKFIICSDEYNLRAITIGQMKKYVEDAKIFIEGMSNLTKANEDIFA